MNTNSSKHPLYAEQDFNSERKGNDTFVVWVVEANKGIQRARLGPFNCSDVPIELANGVSVKFGKSEGHTVGDTWTLPVVRCGDSFPGYASAAVATVAEGTRDVKQVTLDAGLKGEASRYANTWMLLPPTLTVHGADVEVQSITIRDTEDAYWNRPGPAGAGGPHYRIGFNGNDTKCLSWDAPDWVVEETIDSLWECAKHDKGDCVTVTRRQDATHAPNGFIYNVYFDGAQFANVNVPELQVNFNRSNNCSGFESGWFDWEKGETVVVDTLNHGGAGVRFTDATLPFGASDDDLAGGAYRGAGGAGLPLYKVSGVSVAVTFESNLGDLEALQADGAGLSAGATTSIIEAQAGELPTALVLPGLSTGVTHSMRVAARNSLGLSEFSASSSASPSTVPPALDGFSASVALHADEVQAVLLAASHVDAVQVVRTTVELQQEVQEVTISTGTVEGGELAGNYSVRFPSVQVLTVSSPAAITAGAYYLNLTLPTATESGALDYPAAGTACIAWDASAAAVKSALEAIPAIGAGGVEVARSGTGTYSSGFGYSYEIRFVGNGVTGTVPLLAPGAFNETATNNDSPDCTAWVTAANAEPAVGVAAFDGFNAELMGLGTNTEVQRVVVSASARIADGAYRLAVNHSGGRIIVSWTMATTTPSLRKMEAVKVTSIPFQACQSSATCRGPYLGRDRSTGTLLASLRC